jgi:hypothetical protein
VLAWIYDYLEQSLGLCGIPCQMLAPLQLDSATQMIHDRGWDQPMAMEPGPRAAGYSIWRVQRSD